ncbi:MAG: hypothetical protein LJE74_08935 [Proteobacteria bacterium]|jgi:hypothetical protein|nr:hypothetical protein [Pseudomonadota bacterium]
MESPAILIWSVLFGGIGIGYVIYGRRQQAVVPLLCGIALLVVPFFLPNVYVLIVSGIVLTVMPYFIRL